MRGGGRLWYNPPITPLLYRTILIDPPWDNEDSITPKSPFSSYEGGWPYPTMRISEIEKLPILTLADPSGCHLYLWAMNSFIPHACYLMQHWGFSYTQLITWVKPSGVGHWWVNRTQHMLFGYIGKMEMATKCMPNVFGAPALHHSEKPDISYELIEAVSMSPRVELFARRKRPGWDVWGNEVVCDPGLDFHIGGTNERGSEVEDGSTTHPAAAEDPGPGQAKP